MTAAITGPLLLGDPPPESEEWYALRRAGITATDIPRILGLSRHGNALSVWLDKRGDLPAAEASEAARWGQLLEGPVAAEWAARRSVTLSRVGVLAHWEHPWRRACLDRMVDSCPDGDGPCALEIKTRSAWVASQWGGDVPDDVLAQVEWQMHVAGVGHVHVACLIGGQRLVDVRVDTDPQVRDLIVADAAGVWQCVLDGSPPEVDPDALLARVLDAWHVDRSGWVDVPETQARALLGQLAYARAEARAADERAEQARAAVVAELGAGDTLTVYGEPVCTYLADSRGARRLRVTPAGLDYTGSTEPTGGDGSE